MTFAEDLQIAGKGRSPCLPNSAFQHYKIEKKILDPFCTIVYFLVQQLIQNHRKLRKRAEYPLFFSRVVEVKVTFMCGQLAMED